MGEGVKERALKRAHRFFTPSPFHPLTPSCPVRAKTSELQRVLAPKPSERCLPMPPNRLQHSLKGKADETSGAARSAPDASWAGSR